MPTPDKHREAVKRAWADPKHRANRNAQFFARVRKDGGCWLKRYKAARSAWRKAYGPIPEGMQVLHRCDQPFCVRPEHLFLGSQSDNINDAVQKGRWSNNYNAGTTRHERTGRAAKAGRASARKLSAEQRRERARRAALARWGRQ